MHWTRGFIGALALAAAATAVAAESWSGYRMIGLKLGVADFRKSMDFYAALGMKVGPKHNAYEQEMRWDSPAQGSRLILIHDDTGRLTVPAGGSFLMMEVPDVAAAARKLRDAGYPNIGEPRSNKMYTMLMLKDPDGNSIEMLGPPPAAAVPTAPASTPATAQ